MVYQSGAVGVSVNSASEWQCTRSTAFNSHFLPKWFWLFSCRHAFHRLAYNMTDLSHAALPFINKRNPAVITEYSDTPLSQASMSRLHISHTSALLWVVIPAEKETNETSQSTASICAGTALHRLQDVSMAMNSPLNWKSALLKAYARSDNARLTHWRSVFCLISVGLASTTFRSTIPSFPRLLHL